MARCCSSTHQSPWYPGTGPASETGKGKGKNCTINVPLPAGSGRSEIVGSFRQRLMPAAERFQPDLVLISAGFDSRIDDPLGRFRLSDDDFAELTAIMLEIAGQQRAGWCRCWRAATISAASRRARLRTSRHWRV